MVAISPWDKSIDKTKATKPINGRLLPESSHEINFFVTEAHENLMAGLSQSDWGVYDALTDTWIVSPGDPSFVKDPNKEFYMELQVARQIAREFERRILRWLKAKEELMAYESTCEDPMGYLAEKTIRRLKAVKDKMYLEAADLVKDIDKERKIEYSSSFGIPRIGLDNIIFKFLEHGPYGEYFSKLKEFNSTRKEINK